MPWEDRPEGSKEVLWRYSKNPVIPRDILPTSNSVFNSAVVPFKGGYAGVFRCDDTNRRMRLHVGFSADAIHWSISETKLEFECDDKEIGEFVYAYDPRVCFIEVIMARRSAWLTRSISRPSISWRTLICLSTVMA